MLPFATWAEVTQWEQSHAHAGDYTYILVDRLYLVAGRSCTPIARMVDGKPAPLPALPPAHRVRRNRGWRIKPRLYC
jgi:hypothetical protein